MKFLTNIIFFDDLFAEKEYHSFVKRLLFIIEMPYSSISMKSHFCKYTPTTCGLSGILHLANDLCRRLNAFARFLTYCLKFYPVDKKASENKNNGIVDAENHATMHDDSFHDSTRFVICLTL